MEARLAGANQWSYLASLQGGDGDASSLAEHRRQGGGWKESWTRWCCRGSAWGRDHAPRSRPCSLEEQYFKCGIFWDYDAAQWLPSNSEAPVLAGGIPVFLRGSQFSGASELKEGAGEQI